MLRRWAQKNGDQATLRLLLETLCECLCEEEAKQVCECLGYQHERLANLDMNVHTHFW